MLLGTASAATQIEGGALDHSWMDWWRQGHIVDGTSPERANDHYRLWQQDDALMRDLGLQIARIGVEWARVEPQQGVFDEDAVAHYVQEAELLIGYGIRPLVTLHHFTNPMWFEKAGAFENPANLPVFLRFVEKMVTAFGTRVHEYITINEPNVYATNGYFFGLWPPGDRNLKRTVRVMSALAVAHIEAYRLIHALREAMGATDTRVSFANHMRVFAPRNPRNPVHRILTRVMEHLFQGALSKALCVGVFPWPLHRRGHHARGRYCDFIAVNYYTRTTVDSLNDGVRENVPVTDLGWEIYPEGIVDCARKLYRLCPAPIYITENGTCDNADSFRCRYICEHLRALCESELPVERYYHWCFLDNFEWTAGESARFGLVEVDYPTQRRTVKQSGAFFRDVIAAGGVTEAIFERYVRDQVYRTNVKTGG
ncbi:MAG: glycoside hydrolase family 1 protein [Clostridiales bacterium]|nr:glycoside hydrolase family 1 protein [Clostridiales bacterium]